MALYLVITLRTPQFQSSIIDEHYAFLDGLRQQGRIELAGPFSDRSGGAYVLRVANREEAEAVAFSDPLHTSCSSIVTVQEWQAR